VTAIDVGTLMVEPSGKLVVVQRGQRAGGHDDLWASDPGGGDDHIRASHDDAALRAEPKRLTANQPRNGPRRSHDTEADRKT
jgi:hypothetical protein